MQIEFIIKSKTKTLKKLTSLNKNDIAFLFNS